MKNTVYYQWGHSTQGPMLILKYGGSNKVSKSRLAFLMRSFK